MDPGQKELEIRIHGRIIDHLGIQMYQSPVAAIAELIANAWDADASKVRVEVPASLSQDSVIVVEDDGAGMTFEECQERYLNVGYCRRGEGATEKTPGGRFVIGRKGIGKFAGFGIASLTEVATTSEVTGEKTAFSLPLARFRSEEYVGRIPKRFPVDEYLEPDEARRKKHGTKITLKNLSIRRGLSATQYARSMGRRFVPYIRVHDFEITVNDEAIPEDEGLSDAQYVFPRDYRDGETPEGLSIREDDWAEEAIGGGIKISWRLLFYPEPLAEELRGIAVYAGVKLAQTPFFFNLTKAPTGQHGQSYLSGVVRADYLDQLETDLIAPERQRVNWEDPRAAVLLEWGQARVRQLLSIWRDRRGQDRRRRIEEKVTQFSERLDKLEKHERKTVRSALDKLASVEQLADEQFEELAAAIMTAWEQGRLRQLISEIAEADQLVPETFVNLFAEARVLSALHTAEAVKAKLITVAGLADCIRRKDLENAVRDFIASNPWLIKPSWETFCEEKGVTNLVREAAGQAELDKHPDFRGRVDLVLSNGTHWLVVEFMRPGITVDNDHISRLHTYVFAIRTRLNSLTSLGIRDVTGYLVADRLSKDSTVQARIVSMASEGIHATDWDTLLRASVSQWQDFLNVLVSRDPDDARLRELVEDLDE